MPLTKNAQQLVNLLKKSNSFDRLLKGITVISASEGRLDCALKVEREHTNQNGTLHGGMICSLVDMLSTLAIGTTKDNKFGVSVDLGVSFLSAATLGETITISSEVVRTGKNLAFAKVEVKNKDGKFIATGNHTKYMNI